MTDNRGKFLRGADQIANHLFGDPEERKKIYGMVELLPVFSTGPRGRILCGWSGEIDAALSAKGQEPVEQRLPLRSHARRPRRPDNRRRNKTEASI